MYGFIFFKLQGYCGIVAQPSNLIHYFYNALGTFAPKLSF